MNYTQNFIDGLIVRFTYNSTAIEGNTLSIQENKEILLKGKMPNSNKDIREFYEVENHLYAFNLLDKVLLNNEDLSLNLVLDFHKLLLDRLVHDAGVFKTSSNSITGIDFPTSKPEHVYHDIKQWVDNTIYLIEHSDDKLKEIAYSHIQFEKIHPFADGNGRTGRMLMLFLAIKYTDYPAIILNHERNAYMDYLANQDVEGLTNLLEKTQEVEKLYVEISKITNTFREAYQKKPVS